MNLYEGPFCRCFVMSQNTDYVLKDCGSIPGRGFLHGSC
jgi:hypothetical protein